MNQRSRRPGRSAAVAAPAPSYNTSAALESITENQLAQVSNSDTGAHCDVQDSENSSEDQPFTVEASDHNLNDTVTPNRYNSKSDPPPEYSLISNFSCQQVTREIALSPSALSDFSGDTLPPIRDDERGIITLSPPEYSLYSISPPGVRQVRFADDHFDDNGSNEPPPPSYDTLFP